MAHLTAICRALDFVEENLTRQITVADMAAAASYSPYHFSRTFNRVVHHTPYDYLVRRRLSESARLLLETDRKIIDIALEFQFHSPETFSRAFKRVSGVQPSRWKGREGTDQRFLLPRLTREYLQHINRGSYLTPVREDLDALRLVGVMTLVQVAPVTSAQLWGVLAQELQRIGVAGRVGEAYGVTWYPEAGAKRDLLYLAAVEAASLDVARSALVVKTTAPLKCARFVHKGSRHDLCHSLNYIYRTWLPKSGERLAAPLVVERHGKGWDECRDGKAESEWELYIPIA